ncbi:GIY-YIG nuclease family protein [Sphingobacterium sp. MYb382]|uniref:GIY-YIG nuclease family protein n=1 Tax=Sphingobacterium sp. MYb382 TaxID=2745278 RepID=UPI0030AC753A
MDLYFVYILKCRDGSYYTGITNNLEQRLYEHNTEFKPASYTFKRRPVVLLFSLGFQDVNQAINFEKQVKGWSRRKKEALINDRWEDLPGLSKHS